MCVWPSGLLLEEFFQSCQTNLILSNLFSDLRVIDSKFIKSSFSYVYDKSKWKISFETDIQLGYYHGLWVIWYGPNFIELLKHKILLKQKNHCLVKSDYRPRLHSVGMLSKQQLNTSHKQSMLHEILASNMCKISELFSCLSNFILLKQLYEIGPWGSNRNKDWFQKHLVSSWEELSVSPF